MRVDTLRVANIDAETVDPSFPFEFSVSPLNYITKLQRPDAPEIQQSFSSSTTKHDTVKIRQLFKRVVDFFVSEKLSTVLPKWIICGNYDLLSSNDRHLSDTFSDYYRNPDDFKEFVWNPFDIDTTIKTSDKKTIIYIELVNRIDEMNCLIQLCETKLEKMIPNTVLIDLYQIQDLHQLLSIHIETHAEYFDHLLYDEDNPYCPYKTLSPRYELTFSLEDLPDLSAHIFNSSQMWNENDEISVTNPIVSILINMIGKAQPPPCKSRSLSEILQSIMENVKSENTLFTQCISRFMIASLLGIYPTSKVQANFAVRHLIYRFFFLQMGDTSWLQRIVENKFLVVYVMREYIFYILKSLPGLNDYMIRNYFWTQIVDNTYYVMDYVRAELNKSLTDFADFYPLIDQIPLFTKEAFEKESTYFQLIPNALPQQSSLTTATIASNDNNNQALFATQEQKDETFDTNMNPGSAGGLHWHASERCFEKIEVILEMFNKTNLNYCYRTMQKPFVRHVVHLMETVENNNYDEKIHKQRRKIRWNNHDDLCSQEMLPFVFEYWIELMIIHGHDLEDLPSYDFFTFCFKLSVETTIRLQNAQALYEQETDRPEISDVINMIYNENPRDFYILLTYFKAVCKRMSIIVYPLPYNITKLQIESEIKYYNVTDEKYLPIGSGTYPICTNCNEFKGVIFRPYISTSFLYGDSKNPIPGVRNVPLKNTPVELSFTDRSMKASLDLTSGKLYCAKRMKLDKGLLSLAKTDVDDDVDENETADGDEELEDDENIDEDEADDYLTSDDELHTNGDNENLVTDQGKKSDNKPVKSTKKKTHESNDSAFDLQSKFEAELKLKNEKKKEAKRKKQEEDEAKSKRRFLFSHDIVSNFAEADADHDRSRKKQSRGIHKKDFTNKCGCEALERVNLLGNMCYTDTNGCFMRCIGCPTIIKLCSEWSKIGGIGEYFACNKCQIRLSQQEKQLDQSSENAMKTDKFFNQEVPSMTNCCICDKQIRWIRAKKAFIIDDGDQAVKNNDVRMRFASFCKSHSHFHAYIQNWAGKTIPKLSQLFILVKYEHEIEKKKQQQQQQSNGSTSSSKPVYNSQLSQYNFQLKRLQQQKENRKRYKQ